MSHPIAPSPASAPASTRSWRVPLVITAGVALLLLVGGVMVVRAATRVNDVALARSPKGVTVVTAKASPFRPSRRYVGTVEPWVRASIGPQMVAAYVDTVLVRPGDAVTRGQVLATLDCRNASAQSQAIQLQARALQAEQEAISHEAARIAELEHGGFASPNEIERRRADSASKAAELQSTQARIVKASLEVSDCVLRAPFAGEIADRLKDPGAFVHPGDALAVLVDRTTVRVTADVPEGDFGVIPPGTPVRIHALATGRDLAGKVARRSPAADDSTRTIHLEVDVPDPQRTLPVGTTAELSVDVGEPAPASEVPLIAASVRGDRATLFVVEGAVARKKVVPVKGERGGSLFLAPVLPAGAQVVTEGRSSLNDGDRVAARVETAELEGPRPAVASGARP
jgi:membrane fusion protein (multidrug efflux system)